MHTLLMDVLKILMDWVILFYSCPNIKFSYMQAVLLKLLKNINLANVTIKFPLKNILTKKIKS